VAETCHEKSAPSAMSEFDSEGMALLECLERWGNVWPGRKHLV
jgi:hypothetical protein